MSGGTWSSSSRLAAVNSHSAFALPAETTKAHNPLLACGGDGATHIRTAQTYDFTRTIPLSELMQAESNAGATAGRRARTANGTLGRTAAVTTSFSSTLSPTSLPLRVPPSDGYSASLAAVHASRADRLVRQASGWSQGSANARASRLAEEKEERIQIYQPSVHEDLVQAGMRVIAAAPSKSSPGSSASSPAKRRPSGVGVDEASIGRVASAAISRALNPRARTAERAALGEAKLRDFWRDVGAEQARLQTRLRERIARNQAREEASFQAVLDKLSDNTGLLGEIGEYLALHTADAERKKEHLYRAWCTQVYGPIQEAISAGLADRSTSSIEARRVEAFDSFLRAVNRKKQGLYNDVIIEDDYDPLAVREAGTMRIQVGHLQDPLKSAARQSDEEYALTRAFHTDATRIHHQVKTMLPPPIWAKYRIESTPHGRYSLLKGNVQKPVGKRLVEPSASYSADYTTAMSLDHYQVDTDPETAKKQFFPRGKRVDGYENVADRRDYDLLNASQPSIKQRYAQQQQSTNGRATFPEHAVPIASPSPPVSFSQQQLPPLANSPPSATKPTHARFIDSEE